MGASFEGRVTGAVRDGIELTYSDWGLYCAQSVAIQGLGLVKSWST